MEKTKLILQYHQKRQERNRRPWKQMNSVYDSIMTGLAEAVEYAKAKNKDEFQNLSDDTYEASIQVYWCSNRRFEL